MENLTVSQEDLIILKTALKKNLKNSPTFGYSRKTLKIYRN